MYQYKSPNISNIKIDDDTIWTISMCLADQNWIKVGRELQIPDSKLQEIQGEYKQDLRECAYRMLKFWHERTSTCTVQDLLSALVILQWHAPIPMIEKHMKRHAIHLPTDPASNEISKWSNLNTRILSSIVSKIPIKFYQKCRLICKIWYNNGPDCYMYWMIKNKANWSKSSFQNAMERKVNCRKIYLKSSEEWRRNSVPTLIKEMDTGDTIRHISFSNDGTMLAVCHRCTLKIYNFKDFSVRFSRDFEDRLHSSHFNISDSCIFVNTFDSIKVIANAVGLPSLHSTSHSYYIRRPWLQDNIFLTYRKDNNTNTRNFWLNKIPQKGDADNGITESVIHRINVDAYIPGIIQTDGRNILLYKIYGTTTLAFKIIQKNVYEKSATKQNDEMIQTTDHEVDCKGEVRNYTLVPDGNTKVVYILTWRKENNFCFMIIDLVNFELKTTILLVPHDSDFRGDLISNSKCIISGNGSKHVVCVWDLKSGACSTHLNETHYDYRFCLIHPTHPQLIITTGFKSNKFKLRRLNTPKYQLILQQDK